VSTQAGDRRRRDLIVGARRFSVDIRPELGGWTAQARCPETADPFGPAIADISADAATLRLTRWLEWQEGHAHAIEVLREAERAYHRLVAGRAFAPDPNDEMSEGVRRAALRDVETARRLLDAIRATRPR
jgi:hypothetical protein